MKSDIVKLTKLYKSYKIVPSVSSVDRLISEDDKLEFIKAFRELMRLNIS